MEDGIWNLDIGIWRSIQDSSVYHLAKLKTRLMSISFVQTDWGKASRTTRADSENHT